jgi:tetratricopeptide (TPR) repeat protein
MKEVSGVLQQDPENPGALLERGQCSYALGSLDAAARDFQQFSRLEPGSPEGGYLLGLLDLTAGRLDSAVEHFQQAIKVDDKLIDAYYYMAEAYFKNHQRAAAKEALDHCLDLDPTNQKAIALRAMLEPANSQHRK